MAWVVRCAAVLASLCQWLLLFRPMRSEGLGFSEEAISFVMFNSALLLLVRKARATLNAAFLIGLVLSLLWALVISRGFGQGTNSTAALEALLVPMAQWIMMGLAVAFGLDSDRD